MGYFLARYHLAGNRDTLMTVTSTGEIGRYRVTSEEDEAKTYLVDCLENPVGNRCAGRCGCRNWETRIQPRVGAAKALGMELTTAHLCKHLKLAFIQMAMEMCYALERDKKRRTI